MKLKVMAVCFGVIFSPHLSWAGTPVTDTMVCPVGGESFENTGTLSCSTQGRTMSFRPVTSCDFVTRLPVCPSNGLPVYQNFSDEQVADLDSFLETPEFERLKLLPPWQRAYGVSEHLGETGTAISFNLLLNAMWYETDSFLANDGALDSLLTETDSELERSPEESKPFLDAIIGYTLLVSGRVDEAEMRLDRASQASIESEYLLQYIATIRECQSDMQRDGCRPDDMFNP